MTCPHQLRPHSAHQKTTQSHLPQTHALKVFYHALTKLSDTPLFLSHFTITAIGILGLLSLPPLPPQDKVRRMQQLGGQLHPHWLQKVHQLHKQTFVLVVEKGDGPTGTAQSARTTNLNGTKSVFVYVLKVQKESTC